MRVCVYMCVRDVHCTWQHVRIALPLRVCCVTCVAWLFGAASRYKGTLDDGTKFDSASKFTFTIDAGEVIMAWDQVRHARLSFFFFFFFFSTGDLVQSCL